MIIEETQSSVTIDSYDEKISRVFEQIKKCEAVGDKKKLLKLLKEHHTLCVERYNLIKSNELRALI